MRGVWRLRFDGCASAGFGVVRASADVRGVRGENSWFCMLTNRSMYLDGAAATRCVGPTYLGIPRVIDLTVDGVNGQLSVVENGIDLGAVCSVPRNELYRV